MSNKIVFKGTINGVEYTDRDAFNAALQKAVDAGENVQASSQSSYKQEKEPENVIMDLPFLGVGAKLDPNSIKGLTADVISQRLAKAVEKNVSALHAMDQDQRDKYTDILTGTVNNLSNLIGQLDDDISELNNRVAALRARRNVLDDITGFYAATRDMADGGIMPDKKAFQEDEEKIKTKTVLREDQKEEDVQLSPEVENAVKVLSKLFEILK